MPTKARKVKAKPPEEKPIEWTRADPAELAKFDPASKVCTMNCGPSGLDPRSRAERLFLCDDCEVIAPAVTRTEAVMSVSELSKKGMPIAAHVAAQKLHAELNEALDRAQEAGVPVEMVVGMLEMTKGTVMESFFRQMDEIHDA